MFVELNTGLRPQLQWKQSDDLKGSPITLNLQEAKLLD